MGKKIRKYMCLTLLLLSLAAEGRELAWYSGGRMSYQIQREYDGVVEKALDLLDADMLAVTGKHTSEKEGAPVAIYQLDQASNKEMKSMDKLGVPYEKIITKPDAFWMGVRGKQLVVVGSNGRGTAYGILELSRMAGVSPWTYWGDVRPQQQSRLTIDAAFEAVQCPAVARRGVAIVGDEWTNGLPNMESRGGHQKVRAMAHQYYHHLFGLLLRLRANTLWLPRHAEDDSFDRVKGGKELADSFAIDLLHEGGKRAAKGHLWTDDGYGYMATPASDAQPTGVYYHLSHQGAPHDYLWLATTQPGLLAYALRRAYDRNARELWIAQIHDPKVAAYPLSLFMDMAWNIDAVAPTTVQRHLQGWLSEQFGAENGARLGGPMTDFYRLCTIRRPEFMGWNETDLDGEKYVEGCSPVRDTEFNSEEFGNELERYLADFNRIKQQIDGVGKQLRGELADAFFAAVTYPVHSAAAMATKQLQAQEARHIGTARSFPYDDEAQESAVCSWLAFKEIERLTKYYNLTMASGKWNGHMSMSPDDLPVFQAPVLPGKLTHEMIEKFKTSRPEPSRLDQGGAIVCNACRYTAASTDVQHIGMLGHSMAAVVLPKGASVTYKFYAKDGDALLYTALVPAPSGADGDARYAVSVDGREPTVFSATNKLLSDPWKTSVLRGQTIRTMPIHLNAGSHSLTIQALDDDIVLDQWMIDYDAERQFYVFPVKPAL